MRTVELLPDEELDGEVRGLWGRLAALGPAGTPLASLAGHPSPTNRPHLTLAAGPLLPPITLDLPVAVTLDGLILFDGRARMLAWRIVPTPELTALQARVRDQLADPNPLHAPDAWVPHISLARRVSPELLPALREMAGGPRSGALVAARSYDTETRTVTDLPAVPRPPGSAR